MFSIIFAVWVAFGVLAWNEALKDGEIADALMMVPKPWRVPAAMICVLMIPAIVVAAIVVTLLELHERKR